MRLRPAVRDLWLYDRRRPGAIVMTLTPVETEVEMKLILAAFLAAHALIHASYLTPAPPRTADGPA